MSENRPNSTQNSQIFGDFSVRYFGRTIQISASIEAHGAPVPNWQSTCQSLQERINLLAAEMDELKTQNDRLTQRCFEAECDRAAGQGEIHWLHVEVERLTRENHQLWGLSLEEAGTEKSDRLPAGRNPKPITKIIDEIDLTDDM